MPGLIERAQRLADEVLFPAAIDVDRRGDIPADHWDRLAAEGMYGLAAPPELGGPGLPFTQLVEVVETMAGGCLATTFTWMQHHGAVLGLVRSPDANLRERLLADLVSGRTRAGVAFAGVIPNPPACARPARRTGGR